jgi:hypothetical protein
LNQAVCPEYHTWLSTIYLFADYHCACLSFVHIGIYLLEVSNSQESTQYACLRTFYSSMLPSWKFLSPSRATTSLIREASPFCSREKAAFRPLPVHLSLQESSTRTAGRPQDDSNLEDGLLTSRGWAVRCAGRLHVGSKIQLDSLCNRKRFFGVAPEILYEPERTV